MSSGVLADDRHGLGRRHRRPSWTRPSSQTTVMDSAILTDGSEMTIGSQAPPDVTV